MPLRRRSSTTAPLGKTTDAARWKLDSSDEGRHVWFYDRPAELPLAYESVWGEDVRGIREKVQSVEAKHAMGLPLPVVTGLTSPEGNPFEAAKKGALSFPPSRLLPVGTKIDGTNRIRVL